MKKTSSIFAFIFFCSNLMAQTLKTYSGEMIDAILDKGKATYTYYEKGNEIIKHGKFSYTWKDEQPIQVGDKKINVSLKKTINGNYKDGLKDGIWTYSVNFIDYALSHAHVGDYSIPSSSTYSTGSISMQSSYNSGIPNGNWSYTETFKTRYAIPKPYNTWVWSGYSQNSNITLKAQFNDGVLTGNFVYNNPYANEASNFNIDNKGFLIGTGIFDNLGKKTTLTFQDNMLIKEVQSDGSEINIKTNFTEELKDPNFDYVRDSISISGYLDSKMDYFRTNRYFNYKTLMGSEELIGGDYFYKHNVVGGAYYKIDKCRAFAESEACGCVKYKNGNWNCYDGSQPNYYKEAFKAYEKGDYEKSLENFIKVKSFLGENSNVCKDERLFHLEKIDKIILEVNQAKTEFFSKRSDNLKANKNYWTSEFQDSIFKFNRLIIDNIINEKSKKMFNSFMSFYGKKANTHNGSGELYVFSNAKKINDIIAYPFKEKGENIQTKVNVGKDNNGYTLYKNMYQYQYIWHKLKNDENISNIPEEAWSWLNTLSIGEIRYLTYYMTIKSHLEAMELCYTSKVNYEICYRQLNECDCYNILNKINDETFEILPHKKTVDFFNKIRKETEIFRVEEEVMFIDMFSEHHDNFKKDFGKLKYKELSAFIQTIIDVIPDLLKDNQKILQLFNINYALKSINQMDENIIKKEIEKELSKIESLDEKIVFILSFNK